MHLHRKGKDGVETECIILFSIEKRRGKIINTFYQKGAKKGMLKSSESVEKHYIGFYYLVPLSLIIRNQMVIKKTQRGGYRLISKAKA